MRKIKSSILSQNYYVLLNEKEERESKKGRKIHSSILGHAGDKPASISGLTYVGGKLVSGIGGVFEGAFDLIGGIFGNDEYEEYLHIYDTPIQDFNETLDKAYDPGKVMRFVGDVASGVGQSATFLIPYAGQAVFFTGVMGNSVSSAAQKTGKVGFKEYAYGAGSAAMEWALERYIGGTGQTLESLTKSGAKNIGSKLTKSVGKSAAKKTASKMVASQLISSAVGEGVEEFFGNVGDYALLHATGVDRNATFDWGDAFYSFAVGATSGALMGGVSTGVQTAYETKSGSEINQNDKRREILLKEAREIVTKGKNLSGGSDAVATHLSTIEAMLKAYDGATDKKSTTANLALGKINSALMSAEFNIITDRHAEYVVANATQELADYATVLFKETTGETVTVKMLKDVNNQYTRALATMDWAGNVVNGIIGADAKMTAEMADEIEKEILGRQAAAEKQAQAAAFQKDFAETTKGAKEVSEASSWNGEAATYHTSINGADAYMAIRQDADSTYGISIYLNGKRLDHPGLLHLSSERVKEFLSDAAGGKIESPKNGAEPNKRSVDKETDSQGNKTAESAEKQGESGKGEGAEDSESEEKRKMSLGEELKEEKYPFDQYEQKQKNNWKNSKRIVVCESLDQFKDFVRESLQNQQYDKKLYLGKIGHDLAAVIHKSTDIDIEGYNCSISSNEIRKIFKDHGKEETEAPRGQRAITEEDVLNIPSVIQSPDKVGLSPTPYNGKPVLEFTKVINGKTTVKAIVSDKHLDLFVQTMYSGIKKETLATPTGEQAPINTPEANSSTDSFDNSISQKGEKSNTLDEKNEETGKNSLREESVNADSQEQAPSVEEAKELAQAVKETLLSEEGSIGSEEEVKRASKLVKGFKLLAASERNAIIRMLRSGGGIEKSTLSSLAHLMAIRPGMNVLFVSGIQDEGSHTKLSDGARLILLDPTLRHGKKYRADVIFHELYHDLASTEDLRTLTGAVVKSTSGSFAQKIADRYTKYYNGESITEWLNGKKYTKANYNAYFSEHKGVSRATVEEEIAAACMAKVMGSSRFIKEYGGNVGAVRRIYYGLTRLASAIANRSVQIGEADDGFTISFRDVLEYKRAYEVALMRSERQMSVEDVEKLAELLADRDEEDVARAKKYSLGEDVNSDIQKMFGIKSINDYVGVQKTVVAALANEGFFSQGNNIVVNTDSGMVVEITKDGIRETLGPGNRFATLPRELKELKLSTINILPSLIQTARLDQDDVANIHNSNSKVRYSYLVVDADLQTKNAKGTYTVTITVRKSPQKNKFWIHEIRTTKKEQGLSSSGDVNPQQEYNKTLAQSRIISQSRENVKTKYSLSPEQEKLRDEFLSQYGAEEDNALRVLNDYLESKGFSKKEIDAHSSVFAPEEEDAGESRRTMEGVKAYTKKEVAKTLEDAIANVLQPIVGGDVILKGKKKKALIAELFSRMNGAKPSERKRIARQLASEVLAMTVYDDYEINAEYEQMLTDGTLENFAAVKSYLGKISAKHVQSEIYHRVGKKQGNVILRRWANAENGISPYEAISELQGEGILSDIEGRVNEADLILRLNAEYEHLKERSEMRRELVPLATLDPEEYEKSLERMTETITDLFEEGGRETKYGEVVRRYRELLGASEVKHQKELEEQRQKLTNEMDRRLKRVMEEAEHSRTYWQGVAGDARMGRDDARVTAQLVVAAKGLREFLNRDYTPASEGQDGMNKNVSRLCAKAVNRTKVHAAPAVEAAGIVKSWADAMKKEDSNFVGDTVFHSTITTAQYEALSRLAAVEVKEDTQLTIEQKQDLLTLIHVIKHAYNHKNEVFKEGKWVNIEKDALRAVANAAKKDVQGGKFKQFIKKAGKLVKQGALMYMDPLSVAAHMDGYTYDGVMQEYMEEIAFAEARANVMMMQLREPFEAFLEKHKKYAKRLAEAKITLQNGLEITVGQAITLSEMFKRDQAKAGLMLSRIGFRFDDGTSKEIEGFGKQSYVETPNGSRMKVDEAAEKLYQWKRDRVFGVTQLKELGYHTESDAKINEALADFEAKVEAAESQAQRFIDEFGQSREALIKSMEKQFSAEDKEFIKIVSNFFNKTSKKVKTDADMKNLGYTNVIEGYYFPIKRMKADMDQSISSGEWFSEFITAENLSFNKRTIQGAKASIEIFNVWNVVSDHIQGLSRWEHLYLPIQNLNKVYNYNTSDSHTNVVSLKNTLKNREDFDYHSWLSDLMLDVQGARKRETKTALDKGVNVMRSGYAIYQLGFNPQTIVKQVLSWAAAGQFVSPGSIAKGIKPINADKMNTYSVMAAERDGDATVVKALSNTEKINKAASVTMKGISWMDRNVNIGIWSMAQNQIAKTHPDAQIGSEKNLQLAGKLTDQIILYVQDSADAMTKSQAARSSSEIVKGTTMFASSSLKMYSRIVENIGFVKNYKTLSKADQAKYSQKYRRAQKQLARSIGSMAAVAVLTALIAQMFTYLYNKDDEEEGFVESTGKDALGEIFGFVPVIGDAAGYFIDGYDISNFYYDTYNDLLVTVTDTFSLMSKAASGEVIEEWEIGRMLRKNARAIGSLTGIPVRNVENALSGLVRRFSPETGYAYDTLFYNANYTEDMNKALKKGDTELASAILELALKRNKTGSVYSPEVIDTIVKLYNAGYKVLPRDINADEVTTRKQYVAFEKIYSQADEAVEALVKSEEFAALADYSTEDGNAQAMAINTIYTAYYELAEHEVLGKELSKKAAIFSESENPTQLLLCVAYKKSLSMGTVETSLTTKKALLKYMRELGMDKTEQAWAAWLCGYRTDDVLKLLERELAGKENEKELRFALGIDKEEKEAA